MSINPDAYSMQIPAIIIAQTSKWIEIRDVEGGVVPKSKAMVVDNIAIFLFKDTALWFIGNPIEYSFFMVQAPTTEDRIGS